jgi:hypothetical protein
LAKQIYLLNFGKNIVVFKKIKKKKKKIDALKLNVENKLKSSKKKLIQTQTIYRTLRIEYNMLGK